MFRFRNDLGFSLVETMVATFIFALVSAAGVMLLVGYQDGRLSLKAADDRLAQIENARSLIRGDFLNAIDRPVRDPFGGNQTGFEGGLYLPDGQLLKFVRGGHMGALITGDRSALERLEYILRDGQLVRRAYRHTDATPATPYTDRILLDGIERAAVRFEAEGLWTEEWRSGNGKAPLPNLAELTLTLVNDRQLSFTLIVGVKG